MAVNELKAVDDATPKYEVIEFEGREARRYRDGTIRDARGRMLAKPDFLPQITSDNAHDMLRLREEKRRRLYNLGANRVVEDTRLLDEFGEDAHLVERAMTLQRIASTPEAGKAAVMADQSLRKAQGYEADKADGTSVASVAGDIADVMRLLLDAARAAEERSRAVDGSIVDNSTHADTQEN